MSNEIYEFINNDVKAIKRYDKDIQKTYVFIARRIYELRESEHLEKVDYKGYKDIYDLCLNEFGYESSKVRYLISIYLKFFNETEEISYNGITIKGTKKNMFHEFSISQLRYMCEMTDEQIKKCKPEMTVKEIKLIKLNSFGTRVPAGTIENAELIKNNNVIEGVFPEQKEDVPEEKVTTIIVTELPKEPVRENKTITVNVKSEENDDFVTNQEIIPEVQEDYYKKKYHEALEEIQVLQENIANEIEKAQLYKNKHKELQDIFKYFYDEMFKVVAVVHNEKFQNFAMEFSEFVNNNKLPKKIYFMNKVI